jgi:two-component system KDP operon response regulator KdpE
LVSLALSGEGADVFTAGDGQEGLRKLFARQPDLVILDIMMPVLDGWETLRRIRDFADVPVIVLSVLGAQEDVVRGLDLGAVDYVTKPFSMQILLARARAALRRSAPIPAMETCAVYDDGYLCLDLDKRRVLVREQPVRLSDTEFRLLSYLYQNADRMGTYDEILRGVWGWEHARGIRSIHVYVWRLRQKLEEDPHNPKYLLTSRGVGCRFETQPAASLAQRGKTVEGLEDAGEAS